jgi:plastocyanin domain-containing protein
MNKKTPLIIASLIFTIVLIGTILILKNKAPQSKNYMEIPVNNVSIVDGKQIITINAKGGYQPRKSVAKSGLPTMIRFNTNGTFDCSASIRIPSMNISKILPQTGSTDIDIGVNQVGTLQGSCGMGMYPFEVEFKD